MSLRRGIDKEIKILKNNQLGILELLGTITGMKKCAR